MNFFILKNKIVQKSLKKIYEARLGTVEQVGSRPEIKK